MSYSPNSLKGAILWTTFGIINGDTRSLDCGSYQGTWGCMGFRVWAANNGESNGKTMNGTGILRWFLGIRVHEVGVL